MIVVLLSQDTKLKKRIWDFSYLSINLSNLSQKLHHAEKASKPIPERCENVLIIGEQTGKNITIATNRQTVKTEPVDTMM